MKTKKIQLALIVIVMAITLGLFWYEFMIPSSKNISAEKFLTVTLAEEEADRRTLCSNTIGVDCLQQIKITRLPYITKIASENHICTTQGGVDSACLQKIINECETHDNNFLKNKCLQLISDKTNY